MNFEQVDGMGKAYCSGCSQTTKEPSIFSISIFLQHVNFSFLPVVLQYLNLTYKHQRIYCLCYNRFVFIDMFIFLPESDIWILRYILIFGLQITMPHCTEQDAKHIIYNVFNSKNLIFFIAADSITY